MSDTQAITANIWTRVVKMSMEEIVSCQIILHCYTISYPLTPRTLYILTQIGVKGRCLLTDIIKDVVQAGVYTQVLSVRNIIDGMEDAGILVKEKQEGTNKKVVYLHPSMGVQNRAPVYLDFKAMCQ